MSKKALVITAHPSSKGLTHRIAEAYKRGAESTGASVEIMDLYAPEFRQDFLRFENIRETPTDAVKEAIQKKISEADELVFIHPLWWMGPPAILKNFLDVNISARFAFRYVPRVGFWSKCAGLVMGGGKRIGMLQGKTACVFITCDGPLWLYSMMALPFWSVWHFAILYYCGMKTRAFRILDKKTFRPESDWNKYLAKAEEVGARLGEDEDGQ